MRKHLLLTLLGFFFFSLLAWFAGALFADHEHIFLGQNESKHINSPPANPNSFAGKVWTLGNDNDAIRYYAESSTMLGFARTAINRWKAAFPDLKWLEANSTSTTDVLFYEGNCGRAYGRINITDDPAVHQEDSERGALYWQDNLRICLTNTLTLPGDAERIAVLVHEIGHLYGPV